MHVLLSARIMMMSLGLGHQRLNAPASATGQWIGAAFTTPQATWPRPEQAAVGPRHRSLSLCNAVIRSFGTPARPSTHKAGGSKNKPEPGKPEATPEDKQLQQAAARALPALAAAALVSTSSSAQQAVTSKEQVRLAHVPGMAPLLRLAASGEAPRIVMAADLPLPHAGGASGKEVLGFIGQLTHAQRLSLSEELGPLLLAATSTDATQRLPIVFDTETQGLSPKLHRVVDICLKDLSSGMEFSTLVFPGPLLPGQPVMPFFASGTHGIYARDLRRPGVPTAEATSLAMSLWILQRCLAACPGGATPLLIAHNAIFDVKMTGVLLSLSAVNYGPSWLQLCTQKLAKDVLPNLGKGNNGPPLLEVSNHVSQRPSQQLHRAAADVAMLVGVLPHLLGQANLSCAVQQLRRGAFDAMRCVAAANQYEHVTHEALAGFPAVLQALKQAQAHNRAVVFQAAANRLGHVPAPDSPSSFSQRQAPSVTIHQFQGAVSSLKPAPAAASSLGQLHQVSGGSPSQPQVTVASFSQPQQGATPVYALPPRARRPATFLGAATPTGPPREPFGGRSPAADPPASPDFLWQAATGSGERSSSVSSAANPPAGPGLLWQGAAGGGERSSSWSSATHPAASPASLGQTDTGRATGGTALNSLAGGGSTPAMPPSSSQPTAGPSRARLKTLTSPLPAQDQPAPEPSAATPVAVRVAHAPRPQDPYIGFLAPHAPRPQDLSMGIQPLHELQHAGGTQPLLPGSKRRMKVKMPMTSAPAIMDTSVTLGERLRLKKQVKFSTRRVVVNLPEQEVEAERPSAAAAGTMLGSAEAKASAEPGGAVAEGTQARRRAKKSEQEGEQEQIGSTGGRQVVGRGKKAEQEDEQEQVGTRSRKQATGRGKKAEQEDEQGQIETAGRKLARSRAKKAEPLEEKEQVEATTKKPPRSRAKKAEQVEEEEQVESSSKKLLRSRGKKAEPEEEREQVEVVSKKPPRSRAKKAEQEDEKGQVEATGKKLPRNRGKKAEQEATGRSSASPSATSAKGQDAPKGPATNSVPSWATARVVPAEVWATPAAPVLPDWQPCGVDLSSRQATKWFPPAQLQKLLNAGFKSLLQVLMFYPKRHIFFSPDLDPTLPRQDVAVVGTTTKSTARMLGAQCCILSLSIEVPLAPETAAAAADAGAGAGASVSAVVNASVVAPGRWSLGPFMELSRKFCKGSSVLVRGTLKAAGEPSAATADGRPAWTRFDCSGPDLMAPEEFSPADDAARPVYATRLELKPGDCVDRGKRRGAISRALAVLEGQPHPSASDPLSELGEPARRLLDELVAGPTDAVQGSGAGRRMSWVQSLAEVHRPSGPEALQAARRSLAVTEMVMIQLQLLDKRRQLLARRPAGRAAAACAAPELVRAATAALPYRLTPGQTTALREILEDMADTDPMSRLLQGDVGSGKTVVAMLAMLAAAGSGRQALLLAPTEVLAEQHFVKLQELVASLPAPQSAALSCLLLTSSTKNKKAALSSIADGQAVLLVGTHSLLHVPRFQALGLVVIDEQHKFGVRQKEAIARLQHAEQPHVLSMSATPIPRTIALVQYGDMALSTLRDTPPNRKQVITRVLPDTKDSRSEVFAAVRAELDAGGRAFLVYPLREPSLDDDDDEEPGGAAAPKLDMRSAEKEFAALRKAKAFGRHGAALLHGGLSREAKAAALASFRSGATPALVCTIVIEVGVDVTDASILVVEHADRFGLAQLHQLRGRVGRGARQSHCFMLSPLTTEPVLQRLRVLETCHSGFDIAERDLQFRGAGQVFGTGTRQSGDLDATDLCQEEIAKDPSIVEGARRVAMLTMQGGTGTAAAAGSKMAQEPLPETLASAVAAFKLAVKRRPRQSIFQDTDDDEEAGEDMQDETVGLAV